jgi:hypothetical protein
MEAKSNGKYFTEVIINYPPKLKGRLKLLLYLFNNPPNTVGKNRFGIYYRKRLTASCRLLDIVVLF